MYKKLIKVQKEVGAIAKDSTNPFHKSKYFDINKLIEHVEPILSANGLFLMQPIKDGFVYSIIVDAESGNTIESSLKLPENEVNPQKIGTCISYYRRYTLTSLLALQAEDDDGNAASKTDYSKQLKAAKTLQELGAAWGNLPQDQKNKLFELKEKLKLELQ